MNKVPVMISTKDLDYISDMMNWNFVCAKKSYHFASEVTDEEIKETLHQTARMHVEHYLRLVNLLNNGGIK